MWVPVSGRWCWFSAVVGARTVAHGWVGPSVCPPGLGLALGWALWDGAPGLCNSWSLFLPNSSRQRFECGWRDVERVGLKDCAEVRSGPFALDLHLHLPGVLHRDPGGSKAGVPAGRSRSVTPLYFQGDGVCEALPS